MPCQAEMLYLAVHHAIVSAMEGLHHRLGLQAGCSVNQSILLSSKDRHASKAAVQLAHFTPEQHLNTYPAYPACMHLQAAVYLLPNSVFDSW